MLFSERLSEVLKQRDLKQIDLCRLTGFSSAQVAHLVTGRTKDPKLSTVVIVAKALDVSIDYLAGLKPTPEVRLSHDEGELLSSYRELPPDKRDNLRSNARFLVSEERKSDVHDRGVTREVGVA